MNFVNKLRQKKCACTISKLKPDDKHTHAGHPMDEYENCDLTIYPSC